MPIRSASTSVAALSLFALMALSARSAWADSTCSTDTDCVKGWKCQVTGGSACGSACAPGQDCGAPPSCTPQEFKSCVPGACTTDSDCADGMVCYTSQTACDTAPCAPGADCGATTCTPTTQSQCLPRYDVPCQADADCGAGFSCIANANACGCSSPAAAPDAGTSSDAGTPVDPTSPQACECPPATTASCHALPVTCNSDSDCTTGWTCGVVTSNTNCTSSGSASASPSGPNTSGAPSVDAGAAPAADGGPPSAGGAPDKPADAGAAPPDGTQTTPCPPPVTTKLCLPPFYSLAGGSFVSQSSDSPEGGGVSTGTPGSGPRAPTMSDGATQPAASSSGCSVGHGESSGASGLGLLLLGLFGLARRRRTVTTREKQSASS